ncbi:O-antigen ligase family protein [Jeotgalibaca ciconiae]|uniref:O-antigen ligase-related domain-containing protein n=1 Tax=Jeotgalibaca ciconiae TaxID=2496265 RepID=A0A3S9HC30_9LACT|nr:O-antigen ligase family protein [Jeotgalibaca ciconiae]AZP04907.1 hypothetical protein EJN90_09790 [Jeotgalibaca ciconiae]
MYLTTEYNTIEKSILKENTKENKSLSIFLIIFGFFLNQSSIIFGINISFSDILSILILLNIALTKKMIIPFQTLSFFIVLIMSTLTASVYIVPIIFNVRPTSMQILVNYLKLCVNFIYLLLGYLIAKSDRIRKVFSGLSIGALVVGVLALIFSVIRIPFINELFFFGGVRYRGLMNDPNYFAVLQILSLVYIISENITPRRKWFFSTLLIISILMSGSKTGLVTLVFIILMGYLKRSLRIKSNVKSILISFGFFIFITFIVFYYKSIMTYVLPKISDAIPIVKRLEPLFLDFETAIVDGGSGRNRAWGTALELIKKSPIFGVGIGTYLTITKEVYNYGSIAHNTYLQLGVEWGLPLTITLFSYIFMLLTKKQDRDIVYLKYMLIVILIGGVAVSFNNVRIFWLIIGCLIYYSKRHNEFEI